MENEDLVLCVPCKKLPEEWLQKKVCLPMDVASVKKALPLEKCQFKPMEKLIHNPSVKRIRAYIMVYDLEGRLLSYICQGIDQRDSPLWTVGVGCDITKQDIGDNGDVFEGIIRGVKRFCAEALGDECAELSFKGVVHDANMITKYRRDDDSCYMNVWKDYEPRQTPLEMVFTVHLTKESAKEIDLGLDCGIRTYYFSQEITSLLHAERRSKLALRLIGIKEWKKDGKKTAVEDVYHSNSNSWFTKGPDDVMVIPEEEFKYQFEVSYTSFGKIHIQQGVPFYRARLWHERGHNLQFEARGIYHLGQRTAVEELFADEVAILAVGMSNYTDLLLYFIAFRPYNGCETTLDRKRAWNAAKHDPELFVKKLNTLAERTIVKMSRGTMHEKELKSFVADVAAGRRTMTDLYTTVKGMKKELNPKDWKRNVHYMRELAVLKEPYEKETPKS